MRYTTPLRHLTNAWLLAGENIKAEPCRHCSATGHVKNHGQLTGIGINRPENTTRGLRFFCSNRYSNKGCGRTFSVLFSTFITHHSLDTKHLLTLINQLLITPNTHAAWHRSGIPFSLRSVYRWVKKLSLNQPTIRHILHRHTPPPKTACSKPLNTTLAYMLEAFIEESNPVAYFQLRHDTGIFHHPSSFKPS